MRTQLSTLIKYAEDKRNKRILGKTFRVSLKSRSRHIA